MGNGSVWTAGTDRGSGGAGAHCGLPPGGIRTGGSAQQSAAQPRCGQLLGVEDRGEQRSGGFGCSVRRRVMGFGVKAEDV